MNNSNHEPLQTPGEVIRKMLEMKGWTQTELAEILHRPKPTINEVINGKRAIMPELAVALASAFGTDPDYWLSLENQKRLSELPEIDEAVVKRASCYDIAPVKEMQKRGWISNSSKGDELVVSLSSFFDTDNLETTPLLNVAFRKSSSMGDSALSPSQLVWCHRARHIAKNLPAKEYNPQQLNECEKELNKLKAFVPDARNVSHTLSEYGIRFVVVEPLSGSKIDGAAFWIDEETPVIAVSLRYDRIDSFWFTLMHEFSHIRHKDALSVDTNLAGEGMDFTVDKAPFEYRADSEAQSSLIKTSDLESFINRVGPMYSEKRIVQLAHKIKVHPAIIIGQLQHRGEVGFHAFKKYMVKIRHVVTSTAVTDGWGQAITNF